MYHAIHLGATPPAWAARTAVPGSPGPARMAAPRALKIDKKAVRSAQQEAAIAAANAAAALSRSQAAQAAQVLQATQAATAAQAIEAARAAAAATTAAELRATQAAQASAAYAPASYSMPSYAGASAPAPEASTPVDTMTTTPASGTSSIMPIALGAAALVALLLLTVWQAPPWLVVVLGALAASALA